MESPASGRNTSLKGGVSRTPMDFPFRKYSTDLSFRSLRAWMLSRTWVRRVERSTGPTSPRPTRIVSLSVTATGSVSNSVPSAVRTTAAT